MITLLYGEPFPGPWGRLQRDLMASVCLGPSRSLIHMGTRDTSVWITPAKPIKEQTLCQYSLQMSPELSTEDWDEREKPERDCWLTPLVNLYTVKENPSHWCRTQTCPPQQFEKGFLSAPLVFKYSVQSSFLFTCLTKLKFIKRKFEFSFCVLNDLKISSEGIWLI